MVFQALLILGAAGLACGLALALASRFFGVAEDPRVAAVEGCLSGANCGGCGYAGCAAYAEAVAKGRAPIDLCAPGGARTSAAIAKVMGLAAPSGDTEPMVAFVKCGGDADAAIRRFAYNGIADCAAAAAVAGGDKGCTYGCLGYGTCANVCPSHAIAIVNGLAQVHEDICIGCGACARACPRGVIEMVPRSSRVRVLCNSRDPGAAVRKYCKRGCIGCGICARNTGEGVISVEGSLAHVNYSVPFSGEGAPDKCPMKCLRRL